MTRCASGNNPAPVVLLITRHDKFGTTASQQLAVHDFSVRTLSPEQALQTLRCEDDSPVVALVDFDTMTAESSPLNQLVRTTLPNCQIVLICTRDQAPTAARLAESAQVWDYLLIDSVRDPNRVPFLVKHARANVPTSQGRKQQQYEEILQTLTELREILKGGSHNSVIEVLDKFRVEEGTSLASEPLLQELAKGYEGCLVELICGRLRRLENQILLSGGEEAHVAKAATSDRILVVEDSITCAELAKNILEKNGFEVTIATTALEARDALKKCPPALVLMDVHLGDASGIELVKLMRAGNRYPDVPVIMVTSDRMRDTVLKAGGVRVEGYLLKPYQPDLLVEKVEAVLEGRRHKVEGSAN